MKHLSSSKKAKIIEALSIDALEEETSEHIDAAVQLYVSSLEFREGVPKNQKAKIDEARRIQKLASEARQAIDKLNCAINGASTPIQYESEVTGLGVLLCDVQLSLKPWTNLATREPPGKTGRPEQFDRRKFIYRLSYLFEKITGNSATLSHDTYSHKDSKPSGKFYDFVMACADNLPGFANLSEHAIGSAIRKALKEPV